ncbi:hypothetical protein L0664_08940 [Octadecabacter sp. G9-8]|uniref:Aspartate carbamoyltransferase catalytic subunit n=1 Tax=Octadecabacter dasysiphoniae TaxID=2909341 RepID=A0ABS9CV96_9RHOB|nr:hypothetical protein [Octadecabacter dasysiphoniae]MCF2871191.1 hypothetical protein [Octadecabacter dasysiphoniae]
MTQIDPNTVTAQEHGLIRVYSLDVPSTDIEIFTVDGRIGADDPWPLLDALGATHLDGDHIEAFDIADLAGIGLAEYLSTGHGVSEADLAPYLELLGAVSGPVVLVFSRAFGGIAQTLTPERPLGNVATFRQDNAPVTFEPLPDESARGPVDDTPPKKQPSDAAMGGRVATIALLVMAALVWVMIKIAG